MREERGWGRGGEGGNRISMWMHTDPVRSQYETACVNIERGNCKYMSVRERENHPDEVKVLQRMRPERAF